MRRSVSAYSVGVSVCISVVFQEDGILKYKDRMFGLSLDITKATALFSHEFGRVLSYVHFDLLIIIKTDLFYKRSFEVENTA